MRKITLFLAVALLSLALSAPAYGQSATEDAYSGAAGAQQFSGDNDGNGTSGTVTGAVSESGTLPFTGLQLALMGAAALALIGTGIVVRRASRSDGEA